MQPSSPDVYWISGSTPAWRVILALTLKGVAFNSHRLDHGAGENRTPQYLALNPKGQVPTLVLDDIVIRESMAILAWLDRAYPDRPIWGQDIQSAASIWQDVMVFEQDLHPLISHTAKALLRREQLLEATVDALQLALDDIDTRLKDTKFLGGLHPMANDIWLYPALNWIARGVQLNETAPAATKDLVQSRQNLKAWADRFGALPGVEATYPPHWLP